MMEFFRANFPLPLETFPARLAPRRPVFPLIEPGPARPLVPPTALPSKNVQLVTWVSFPL